MIEEIKNLFENQGGGFISSPSFIYERLKGIKAYIFDWDGVFNNGAKSENTGSGFSEPDSMGLNLLRFGYWMANSNQFPYVSIITGEINQTAIKLAERENFHHIYFNFKNKALAFDHFLSTFNLKPEEVAFCFDDILDIPIAKRCGLRFLIKRSGSPLFVQYVKKMHYCDYITGQPGGQNAVREISELILGMLDQYETALKERTEFSILYTNYLEQRKKTELKQFKFSDIQIK
jgi:3-deoxy-D-manno-octulosonate 8-phosphate phosphatase (KDO 8-P phosphatase)